MISKLKIFFCILSFSIINNIIGQVDTSVLKNKEIQNEAIEIRKKIKNFMNEKLLIDENSQLKEQKLANQNDQLILLQNAFDTLLSIVYNQNKEIDTLSIKLQFLEDYIGLNGKSKKNNAKKKNITNIQQIEEPIAFPKEKNNVNVVTLNAKQFYKFKSIDSVTILFDKNSFKLNYPSVLTLDSILPFLLDNNILLIGYDDKNEINNDYAVKRRVKDVKLYLISKGLNPLLIATDFIKDSHTDNNTIPYNFSSKVNVVFGK